MKKTFAVLFLRRIRNASMIDMIWRSIVGLGILFRLRQYFSNRSLWVDEASLALNIIERSFYSLTLPLDFDQGAPLGFLFIEKLFVLLLGNTDFVLRLFPLISGVFAVILLFRISRENFGDIGIVALFLFSMSHTMIYYSSELKQYSSDVMFGLLLVFLVIRVMSNGSRHNEMAVLGLAGVVSILTSHPSIFFLPVVGVLLFIKSWQTGDRQQIRWLLVSCIFWVVTFLIIYSVSLSHLLGNDYLQEYWGGYYAPLPPWEHLDWYRRVLFYFIPPVFPTFIPSDLFGLDQEVFISIYVLLFFAGGISLLIRNSKLALLFMAPLGFTFIASVLNRYPMGDRFMLFWFPFFLMFVTEGVGRLYLLISHFNTAVGKWMCAFLILLMFWAPLSASYQNFIDPPMGEDIKPVLEYIRANMLEKDIIYVHNGSVTPFYYYAPLYGLENEYTFVAEKSWNVKRFTIDVIELQGNTRVWFVFSHVISCDCDGDRVKFHVGIIDGYGKLMDHFEAEKASVYLYDMVP